MNVQELLDFLETASPDPDAEVLVSVGGRVQVPRFSYAMGKSLLIEIPTSRSKRKPPAKKATKKK